MLTWPVPIVIKLQAGSVIKASNWQSMSEVGRTLCVHMFVSAHVWLFMSMVGGGGVAGGVSD